MTLGQYRFTLREHAGAQHDDLHQIGRIRGFRSGGGPTAEIRDESLYIVVLSLPELVYDMMVSQCPSAPIACELPEKSRRPT